MCVFVYQQQEHFFFFLLAQNFSGSSQYFTIRISTLSHQSTTCRVHHAQCWAGWSTSGTQIAGRNISNLRYADDTTLMAESEELKSLLMKLKESQKVDLKLTIQKTKIMASSPITSCQIDGETVDAVTDSFLGLQNHCRWWLQPWN